MTARLFPIELEELQWLRFAADGFSRPVCGIVYRAGQSVCGLPLGGLGTGCVDLNTEGTLGRATIFNSFTPPREINAPFLALSTGGKVWVLSTERIAGVDSASQIHYWGHYPVADLEYELDGPMSVGLRAFSPLLPGDSVLSNTPGAVRHMAGKSSPTVRQPPYTAGISDTSAAASSPARLLWQWRPRWYTDTSRTKK